MVKTTRAQRVMIHRLWKSAKAHKKNPCRLSYRQFRNRVFADYNYIVVRVRKGVWVSVKKDGRSEVLYSPLEQFTIGHLQKET